MDNDTQQVAVPTTQASTSKTRRPRQARPRREKRAKEQSTIAFPYNDLDSAISIARAILDGGGGAVTREQLAGAMRQSVRSGAFILKVSAARQFGLIDINQGKVALTDLGFNALDKNEGRSRAARAAAFLSVALFKRIYEDFRGRQLPPRPHGLEQTIVQYGVAPKQKSAARLAFEKSAKQAGFSTVDPDRLIEPILAPASGPAEPSEPLSGLTSLSARGESPKGPSIAQRYELDPLIQGLLARLPKAGDAWGAEKRKRWLQTLEANLEMIYPLTVESEKPGTDQ